MAITAQAPAGFVLLSNASATSTPVLWPGGKGTFLASATFGGGTVKLQVMGPDGTNYIDVGTDTTLTAAGGGRSYIRANVATATAVYATVSQVID
jgi:hypothetical protein